MSTPLTSTRASHTRGMPVRRPQPFDEPGIRFVTAEVTLTLATLAAGALGLGVGPACVVLVAVALLAGVGLSARWTVALAISAWALATGFVEHQYGDLSLAHADLVRLAGTVFAGVVVGLVGTSAVRRG